MELRKQLVTDLYQAMRDKNELEKNTIRIILSSLKLAEIEKGHAFDDSEILSIIQKEIKMRTESIAEFTKGNRQDLIDKANDETKILEKYLPRQLSDDELTKIIDQAIVDVDAQSPSDMGKVMKIVLPLVQGQASADRISKLVRARLIKE